MPTVPAWKSLLDAGSQFTQVRRSQARQIVADLVAQGQVARDQAAAAVEELVDSSRRRTEELADFVRAEVQRQLERQVHALGIATKADLERLERRVKGVAKAPAKAPAKRNGAAKKATRKAPAKKAAKRAPAKKAR